MAIRRTAGHHIREWRPLVLARLFLTAFVIASLVTGPSSAQAPNARRQAADDGPAPGRVVFVCEHGSVKSVMAAHWFNRLAAERKAPFRAISRGVAPDDTIPPAVALNLAQDGFDAAGFTPKRLEKADLVGAAQVVAIGIDSPLFAEAKEVPVDRWSDIPPASTQYAASRDAMRARMGALLDSMCETRGGCSCP